MSIKKWKSVFYFCLLCPILKSIMKSTHLLQQKKGTLSGVKTGVNINVQKVSRVSKRTRTKSVTSYVLKKVKRYIKQGVRSILLSPSFHSSFKVVATAVIVVSLLYGSYLYIGKTFANEIVVSQSEIVARVSKLTVLPQENPYEIVRVQDEEDLQKQNPFYKNVKEGNYILMYKNLAVIYDLRNNVIVGIKRD